MSREVVEAPMYSLSVPLQEVDSSWVGGADNWPLHVTLVPDFRLLKNVGLDDLLLLCRSMAEGQGPFYVNFGELQDGFGTKPVQLVEGPNRAQILALHTSAMGKLKSIGFELANSDWVGESYNPHTSVENEIDSRLRIVANSVMLVKKVDYDSGTTKEIVDVWRLGKDGEQARILRNI